MDSKVTNQEMHQGTIVINSIAEYLAHLSQLDPSREKLFYRGQADSSWIVNCSAARRLTQDSSNQIHAQLIDSLLVGYLEFLVAKAKLRKFTPQDFDPESPDLEFLAQLQHHGAATGLIDFTSRPLVALWFACHESHENDGAVYALPQSKTRKITNNIFLNNKIAYYYKDDTLWSWEPAPLLDSRILAQGSVFVFGGAGIASSQMKKVIIPCKL